MDALRILLVEDSESDADLILLALDEAGLTATGRRVDTEAAMRDALTDSHWDLVVADFNLPRFDAASALAVLRGQDIDIPFIVVSGFIGEEAAVAILKAGAHDFVTKDHLARLGPAIERELREAETRRAHRRATEELVESRRQLRDLSAHLQTVREEERARIARELHDELGQMLTALKIDVSRMRGRAAAADATLSHRLDDMTALIEETITAVRRISSDLRPVMLDDLGLKAAVEWLVEEMRKRDEAVVCELTLDLNDHDVASNLATAAFRIVQESLTNACKYAQASEIKVFVGVHDGELAIMVRDNGLGLPPSPIRKGSYGLIGLRERVQAFNGRFDLRSAPNQGVAIDIAIPLPAGDTAP